ncbi:MAG: HypC/HybG/HupF family hydrogenase formation chaperone [Planctomycetes bacterium]|nr:HypC/HybG/HupF family hydrogenase formation chaperone [Planctomycetota bacterium]
MCLAVPGRIVEIKGLDEAAIGRVALVDFNGSRLQVSLALTSEADVGDWVLVHAGYAITVLDEAAALETWEYLNQIEDVGGLLPANGQAESEQ